jgi:hypothetical protein
MKRVTGNGIALISVVLVMLILVMLATAVTGITTMQGRYSLKRSNEIITRQAALAGLNECSSIFSREEALSNPLDVLTSSIVVNSVPVPSVPTYSVHLTSPPIFNGVMLTYEKSFPQDGCFYSVQATPDIPNRTCHVISRGYFKDQKGNLLWPKTISTTFKVGDKESAINFFGGGGTFTGSKINGKITADGVHTTIKFISPSTDAADRTIYLYTSKTDGIILPMDAASAAISVEERTVYKTGFPPTSPDSSDTIVRENTTIGQDLKGSTITLESCIVNANIWGDTVIINPGCQIYGQITANTITITDADIQGDVIGSTMTFTRTTVKGSITTWGTLTFTDSTLDGDSSGSSAPSGPTSLGGGSSVTNTDIVTHVSGDISSAPAQPGTRKISIVSWEEQ